MRTIAWKGVYCNPQYEAEVNALLDELYKRVNTEHPEYCFDVDGPDWEEDDQDEGDCSEQQKKYLEYQDRGDGT